MSPFFIFAAVLGAVIWRAPNLLLEPRFWAEEGTVYFRYALSQVSAFWVLIAPHQGYYNLFINLTTLLAREVPLQYAPWITTYAALLIQMIPYALILWGKSDCWSTLPRKIAGCLILLLSPAHTGEIWLTMTNVHFYFSICTFLILLEPAETISQTRRIVYGGLLLASGLSSVTSLFLMPLFLIAAFQEKSGERARQGALLAGCLVLQMLMWKWSHFPRGMMSGRRILEKLLFVCFKFGVAAPIGVLNPLAHRKIIAAAGAFATLFLLPGIKEPAHRRFLFKSLAAYLFVLLPSMVLSHAGTGAPRYAYAPGVMLLIFYFGLAIYGNKIARPAASLFLGLVLAWGAVHYKSSMKMYNAHEVWPVWRLEVQMQKEDPKRPLRIWPQETEKEWKKHHWQIFL